MPAERHGIEQTVAPVIVDGLYRGASVLNAMLSAEVSLEQPTIAVVEISSLASRLSQRNGGSVAWVRMGYTGDLSGAVELVLELNQASRLAQIVGADLSPGNDADAIRAAVVSEVGNVVINSVVGTFSNAFSLQLEFTVPDYAEGDATDIVERIQAMEDVSVILVETSFHVAEHDIHGHMLLYFAAHTFERLKG